MHQMLVYTFSPFHTMVDTISTIHGFFFFPTSQCNFWRWFHVNNKKLLCSVSWLHSVPLYGSTITYLTSSQLMDTGFHHAVSRMDAVSSFVLMSFRYTCLQRLLWTDVVAQFFSQDGSMYTLPSVPVSLHLRCLSVSKLVDLCQTDR